MGDNGIGRALVCAVLGVALAVGGPYALAGVDVAWQRIVLMSLLLLCVVVLVACVVLAMVAEICFRAGTARADRVLLLADAFLMGSVGCITIVAVFSFVLAVTRLA